MDGRSTEACRRTARGFGALFWGLLFAMAGTAFVDVAPRVPSWMLLSALLACWAFGVPGLLWLGRSEVFRARRGLWRAAVALSMTTAGLAPMFAWWRLYPRNAFFACNAAAYAVAGVALLFVLVRMAAACGAWLDDQAIQAEGVASTAALVFTLVLAAAALWWTMRDLPDRSLPALMRHGLQIHAVSRFCMTALLFGLTAYPVRMARHAAAGAASGATPGAEA